ncbi:sigma 54-interacting transcriptional regulator [Zhongshania sp.]|uniref:sigma 54-interacting transcriptional regulator n=1 Tax=Zhongshania sp. TaxID=1971902 RepID=UPI002A7FEA15|nr:sigma 54-interacting transcriptional regulator [Zhongshania sp.]
MKFKWNAVVIALLLAVAAPVSALPENGLKFVETADGRQSARTRELVQWTHSRLVFEKTLKRVAVGQESTMQVEVLGANEVLALAKKVGRTSIMVWYTDGSSETFLFSVVEDLSVLRRALSDIHPNIRIQLAPDRAALVLRGKVPTVDYRMAAESAARNYLDVGLGGSRGNVDVLMQSAGGTLFLDELCEMDLNLQAKLLRFLQTGTFSRVGGQTVLHSDIRIVCATNRDPAREVGEGRFREDLYYRLNVIPVQLPPLRERGADIMLLAEHFLAEKTKANDKHFRGFTPEVKSMIMQHDWPGNIRELQNVIENVVVINDGELVSVEMMPSLAPVLSKAPAKPAAVVPSNSVPSFGSVSSPTGAGMQGIRPLWIVEKEAIEYAIEQCGDNIPLAAACLGVSASTIYRKKKSWDSGGQG